MTTYRSKVELDRAVVWQAIKTTVLRPRAHMTAILLVLVFCSAIALVWTTDRHRSDFIQLQAAYQQQDKLYTQWTQLLLEESTWSAPLRVEDIASQQLNMQVPNSAMIRQVREATPMSDLPNETLKSP